MDQQKRLFIAIALSLGLTLIFTNFVWKPEADAEQARLAALDAGARAALAQAAAFDAGAAAVIAPAVEPVAAVDGGVGTTAAAPEPPVAPLRRLEQTRETMTLAFTTEGGGFEAAVLRGKREHVEQELTIPEGYQKLFGLKSFPPPAKMNMAQSPAATAGHFAVSIAGAAPVSPRARYAVADEQPGKLVLTTTQGPWQLTRTLTWDPKARAPTDEAKPSEKDPTGYSFDLTVDVKNISAQALTGELVLHTARAIDPTKETAPSMFGGIGNEASVLCRTDTVYRKTPSESEPNQEQKGLVHFVGIDQQYFLSAAWPASGPVESRCTLRASPTERLAELFVPLTLQPGETASKRFGLFLGPKDVDLLARVGVPSSQAVGAAATVGPGLDQTVDFGWWAFICKALIVFLRFFHQVGNNWGVAIILLTVMVKIVLLPLTHRAMVSAESMKKLQPKMEEIKKKYADDRERQNMETMKLYQEAKVNPLGGCLPLLLQLPIWAALFTTLRTSYELYGEPFFGVWSDLTSKDPTYLLPLLLGITMIVTQRLQPQMMDKSQAFLITWVMPVFFTAIMINYPAGLSLYIFTNNLLSIAQQFALRKYLERTGVAAVKPNAGKA